MYNFIDFDHPAIAIIYSLSNIIIGTFFMINLILAVIVSSFVEQKEKGRKEYLRLLHNPEIEINYD